MAIENFNEITEYFTTNKDSEDVKNFMNGLINVDKVKNFLETNEEGKQYLQTYGDKRVTKGVETFKTNTLPKLIEEEIAKRNPSNKDPREIKLEQALAEIDKIKAESLKKDLANKALKVATEKKLPSDILNYFIGSDEETTMNNLTALEKSLETYTQSVKDDFLKSGTHIPPKGDNLPTTEEQAQAEINKCFGL
ncbi:DUF4355 domain-containing protein [Clostridium sp. P21]|uniref:DUF4355 domain-containing protein n=1 Tax=Clostridium muellerianum TaxID=2716538 RepID=A0A7Y0EJR1_9CLOT|nr:DUF4355 domain-containing protein [Clostridium muellerianum]NMM64392.1 DUF4355 domain-containing protein [Clostridium muellerianum]